MNTQPTWLLWRARSASNGRSITGDDQLVAAWWFEETACRV